MPDPLGALSVTWPFYAAFLIGYAVGSVPFGWLLTRAVGLGDIRNIGSGNIGATNVLRTGRKGLAALTLLLDALKGALPVLIALNQYGVDIAVVIGVGAVMGHALPLWLRIATLRGIAIAAAILAIMVGALAIGLTGKGLTSVLGWLVLIGMGAFAWGGKGVATGLGVLLAINPAVGALACLTWLIALAIFRYSSLAALIAFLAAPIYAFVLSGIEFDGLFLSDPQRTEFAAGLFLLILLRHAGNIVRLIRGDEPKVGGARQPAPAESPGR